MSTTNDIVAGSELSTAPLRSKEKAKRLSPAASLVLDIVRFGAALTVAVGHYTLPMFSSGFPNLIVPASGAVGVFFVLSGFVISYATRVRESNLKSYLVDRASRLLSVVIPALIFTIFADAIRYRINHDLVPESLSSYLLHVFTSLTFITDIWFQHLVIGSNGPFWSLSYEAFYYVLYGVGFYMRGWKRIVFLTLVCLFAGPSILFLAPAWFFGCYLHDVYQSCRHSTRKSIRAIMMIGLMGVIAFGLFIALPHPARKGLHVWVSTLNSQLQHWHMQEAKTWYLENAIPAGILLLITLLAVERLHFSPDSHIVRALRFIADSTFPLYLFHLPMLFLLRALVPYDPSSKKNFAIIITSVVIVCVCLGRPCDWLKDLLRKKLAAASGI